ncbi:MAG: ABC transporter permease subunit [Bacilli bacterium]
MYKFYLKRKIKSILIWMTILIAFTIGALSKFESFANDTQATEQLLNSFPKVIMIVYGMNDIDITQIEGYYAMIYQYITIILGVYGAILGSKIIYEEEDLKTSEFIFTKPIKRAKLYLNKILCSITVLIILNLISICINYLYIKNNYFIFDLFYLLSFLQFIICLFSLSLGLMFSTLKYNKYGTILSAGFITLFFILKVYAEIKELNFSYFSIFYAFSYNNISNNFSLIYVLYYMILTIILILIGKVLLQKKDLI